MTKLLCTTALVCVALALVASNALAQQKLRWGGDVEGGGPYVYGKPEDPTRLIGFEVELADALGKELGMQAQFTQGSWNQLLQELRRGNTDIVLNGYEYTQPRAQDYLASYPYYIYELGLAVRRDNQETSSWNDLKQRNAAGARKRIGVLGGSGADDYVTANFQDFCEIARYDSPTEAMRLVQTGQLDATVQDLPILWFYILREKQYTELSVVDRPAGRGYYVIYARPEDASLIERINRAIVRLHERGVLRTIYEKYDIWSEVQNQLPATWENWDSGLQARVGSRTQIIGGYVKLFLQAAGVTVLLALLSMPLAILIGLVVSLFRCWSLPSLGGTGRTTPLGALVRAPFTFYVEVIRGSPLAFQLFVIYFVLPEIGLRIPAFWAGVMALAINYSAYQAEIFRLGLQAIPRGQIEAALSLGMPRGLAVRRIVLPQAVRIVIPATANDFIALFKDTAVCSVIAVEELSKQYSMAAKSTNLFLEMAILASILYLAMSYPLSLLAAWLERKLKKEAKA